MFGEKLFCKKVFPEWSVRWNNCLVRSRPLKNCMVVNCKIDEKLNVKNCEILLSKRLSRRKLSGVELYQKEFRIAENYSVKNCPVKNCPMKSSSNDHIVSPFYLCHPK